MRMLDSHQHFWKVERGDYGWLTPEAGVVGGLDLDSKDFAERLADYRRNPLFFGIFPNVARALVETPGLRALVDHISKPEIAKAALNPWRTNIAEIAALSNVSCKVSGMVTEAGVDFHVPFGGRKASSFGSREQGKHAVEFFTSVKTSYTLA
jgi:L-fuconolactonase